MMNFDQYLAYAKANGKGSNPFDYAPDQMARQLGYSGDARTFLGWGGSPSESTGQGTEAMYGLSPEFETFLRQYDYTPGMQGSNADVDIRDSAGNLKAENFRTGDHTGSLMKAAGIAIPALVAGGFGAGALGAMGVGPMAAAPAGDAWGATLADSLNGFGLQNVGAAAESGIGAATGVDALPALTQSGINAAAFGQTGDLMGQAMIPGALSAFGNGLTQAAVNSAAIGAAGSLPGLSSGGIPWAEIGKASIGPLLSTGAQIYGANQASNAMADATNKANELQRYVYDTNRTDNMPALTARNSALEQMQALLKDPSTLTSQPGYAFGLNEGTKSLNSGAAARGMTYSGAQGKALTRYGQDYAGTKLNDSFNRLSALAGSGQAGAGQISQAGQNYGTQVGSNITNQGNANAMPWLVGSNAVADGINGLTAYGQRKNWWGG